MNRTNPRRTSQISGMEVIRRVYDIVHMGIWSLFIVFVIYFSMFILPQLPHLQAEMEANRILALAAENRFYCTKWGFAPGTEKHGRCILDVQELRAKIGEREADEAFP